MVADSGKVAGLGGESFFAGSKGDPHLAFAHGGKADLRGTHSTIYCFLSAPSLALNVKTEVSNLPALLLAAAPPFHNCASACPPLRAGRHILAATM